jgi:hypothetical protein
MEAEPVAGTDAFGVADRLKSRFAEYIRLARIALGAG